jgi:hypothetical protein
MSVHVCLCMSVFVFVCIHVSTRECLCENVRIKLAQVHNILLIFKDGGSRRYITFRSPRRGSLSALWWSKPCRDSHHSSTEGLPE